MGTVFSLLDEFSIGGQKVFVFPSGDNMEGIGEVEPLVVPFNGNRARIWVVRPDFVVWSFTMTENLQTGGEC